MIYHSDDHLLISWKFEGGIINSKVVTEFPDDFYPTDMQWHPRPSQTGLGAVKKQAMDVLLITTTDGRL
jgi:intraflagellar transport protein 80